MEKVSNWNKFVLLHWKNWKLQESHKCGLIAFVLVPVIFCSVVVLMRIVSGIKNYPASKFDTVYNLNSLELYNKTIDERNKALFFSPKNDLLENVVKEAAQTLNINDYESFEDAKTLEKEAIDQNVFAAIQFDESYAAITELPTSFNFILRFPGYWPLDTLFSETEEPTSAESDVYLDEGFLPLQYAISMAYIAQKSKKTGVPETVLQQYPYPAYKVDELYSENSPFIFLLPFIIFVSFFSPCTTLIKDIISEKEYKLKEILKIQGLSNWLHWTAWFVMSLILLTISVLFITIIWKIPISSSGPVLTYSSYTTFFIFLLVYIITSICFCFMLAAIFSKSSTATVLASLVIIASFLPYLIFQADFKSSFMKCLGLCLVYNTAMGIGIQLIINLEGVEKGLRWKTITTPVWENNEVTMAHVIVMMLISCIIYIIICLYLEQIVPREYGIARKWYFPVTRQFWCCLRKQRDNADNTNVEFEKRDEIYFEAEPNLNPIGVQIKNLKKKFGDTTVVNNLSLNMFENEITVLLGHNGAGKTTLILMLTGIYTPTSGTATINGSDIRTDMEGCRKVLSICPQHDILFADLSVSNHIRFFSRMKGLKGAAVENEVKKYLEKCGLQNKAKERSATLSGGMKRKLSLSCALCGDSKVVLCDEPSSGIDPLSRRQLWNLLEEEKSGRTILLTTHFMDEADVLGDRIAIMCNGELKCSGTSFFLKKNFGSGYILICEKGTNCQTSKVTALLNKYIPELKPESDIGSELSYVLPNKYSDRFENMFGELEDSLEKLNLNGFGIGISSLEEVFMKMGAEKVSSSEEKEQNRQSGGTQGNESMRPDDTLNENERLLRGKKLCLNQWRAMMLKKIFNTWHSKIFVLFQILFPVLMLLIQVISKSKSEELPVAISHSQYSSVVTVLERSKDIEKGSIISDIADQYENLAKSQGEFESTGSKNFSEYILGLATSRVEQLQNDERYLTAATFKKDQIIAWLNTKALHAGPLTVNMVQNAIARVFIGKNTLISVLNWPLPSKNNNILLKAADPMDATWLTLCFCFTISMFMLFLIKERQMRAKLMQIVGGVSKSIFWLSHFVWDLLIHTISVLLIILGLFCFQMDYALDKTFFVLMIFGCTALLYIYALSLIFFNPASAFIWTFLLNYIFGLPVFMNVAMLDDGWFNMRDSNNAASWLFRLIPHFALSMSLYKTDNQHKLPEYATMPFLGWEFPGILFEVICMAITFVASTLIILLCEVKFFMRHCKCQLQPQPSEANYYDDDVDQERKTVSNMSADEVASKNLVVNRVTKRFKSILAVNQLSICVSEGECFGLLGINGAGKTTSFNMLVGYTRMDAGDAYVQGLSLRSKLSKVYKKIGYCPQFDALLDNFTGRELLKIFCLLHGVRPAQVKTVLEKLAKSLGFTKHLNKQTKVYSGGNKRKLSTAIAVTGSPDVIYLDEPTTGMDPASRRQLWNIINNLRDSGKSIVLTTHSMDECEALCTRIAIMVNGQLRCIGSKQHLKNKFSKGIILKIKIQVNKDNRSSTTSLSKAFTDDSNMNESRATLQSESSDHTEVTEEPIRTKEPIEPIEPIEPMEPIEPKETDNNEQVKEFVLRHFPESTLKYVFNRTFTFYIPLAGIKWSKMFGLIERNRKQLKIEDYSISQTSLEEIFLELTTEKLVV